MKALEATSLLDHPYSLGVMLAVNAVSDAYLLLDAPTCAQWRPGFIQSSHDSTSTLWDSEGAHRVQISCTTTEMIIKGNLEDLSSRLGRMAQAPGCGAVVAAGFPMARISGTPYETLWRALTPAPSVPFFAVTGGAVSDDWLDGYAHTLLAFARDIALPERERRAQDVAVVGYMHDRGERDHAANIAEMRRMLGGLGLNLVSVWPVGGPTADLAAAASAGAVVSLPYGREAAALLAQRLGARLIETGLPLGLNASAEWLAAVGSALGRQAQAAAFAEKELTRLAPRLTWAVEELFLHSRFVFVGDPVLLGPLARQLAEVGGRMVGAVATAGPQHARLWDGLPFPVHAAPSDSQTGRLFDAWFGGADPADCLIGSADRGPEQRPVELGYPSNNSHAFHDRPYLGFEGALCLLGRIAEELRWGRRARSAQPTRPARP